MRKSTAYFIFAIFCSITAVILMLTGQADVRVGVTMVIGWICLAVSDVLEALGR